MIKTLIEQPIYNIDRLNLQSQMGTLPPIDLPQFGFTSLNQAINTLVSLLFFVAALAAFFYLLYAGLRFITSGGGDEGVNAAKAIVRNVVIGMFLLASAYIIFQLFADSIPGLDRFFSP